MKRVKSTCMVLVVLLAGAGMGQEAPKKWVQTTCLVKVSQDHEQMEIVGSLAGTADIAGKAARDALGLNEGLQVGYENVSPGVVKLFTELPLEASPKASAFWKAVGTNLSRAMEQVYDAQVGQIRMQLDLAERQKAEVLARLQGQPAVDPRTRATQEQLDKVVDLAGLNREMALSEAIEQLRNAVKPPLPLVVLWNDLREDGVETTSPIGMDAVNQVRMETALKLLVKSMSAGPIEIGYAIDDGVVIVGTKRAVQSLHKEPPAGPQGQLSADQLAARRRDLVSQQQDWRPSSFGSGPAGRPSRSRPLN